MKRGSFILVLLFGALVCMGQDQSVSNEAIRKTEMELRQFSDSVMRGSSDKVREVSISAFNAVFLDLLSNPATFNYPFDSLPAVSKITSADGYVRIYTWILPSREDGTFKYYGIIHRMNPKSRQIKIIGLMDFNIEKEAAEANELKSDTWYGAAYYELIEKKINKSTQYIVLGWKGNDRLTTKKVIDLLYFDEWDNVTFGAPVFVDDAGKKKYRMIFEYNAQAVMLLRYDKQKKMIVFDHLSPSSPSAKGQFRYYGPDFTYDGLQFKKGLWNYKTNLDLRNAGDRK
jgi:hypothetical protein